MNKTSVTNADINPNTKPPTTDPAIAPVSHESVVCSLCKFAIKYKKNSCDDLCSNNVRHRKTLIDKDITQNFLKVIHQHNAKLELEVHSCLVQHVLNNVPSPRKNKHDISD